tara:strand:+ start:6948 stop:7478 length:531 start_codon:yes stop_codon:yes gene_type:complete
MASLPEMSFGHLGINVINIDRMVDFYTSVLGFKVTDRGSVRDGNTLVFLSRNPEEHHQIVMADTRNEGEPSTINQISFRVNDFAQVRQAYDHAVAAGVEGIEPVDHGSALSVYFRDPEGNRLEVYMATPWYIAQPHRQLIDFDKSDEEVWKACEEKCLADPTYQPMDEWKAAFAAS